MPLAGLAPASPANAGRPAVPASPAVAVGSDAAVGDRSPDPAWKLCVRGTFLEAVSPAAAQARRSSDPGLHNDRPSFFAEAEGYARQLQEKVASVAEELARLSTSAPSLASARSRASSSEGEAGPPDAPPPSSGSVGHPELCRLPCRAAGPCRASCCSFCHHCAREAPRRNALDKMSRQTVRLMDRHALVEMLLGVMRDRVAALGLGEEAAQALEVWRVNAVAGAPPARAGAGGRGELRRLLRFLKTLHLNDLCFLQVPLDVRAASVRLLDKLRDLSAAAPERKREEEEGEVGFALCIRS